MMLAAHQPQYLPWLGLFDKLDQVDQFVLLDNVQFKKNEWQNRNRIKEAAGWQWLTVPVRHRLGQLLATIQIADDRWRRKHRRALELCYARSPFYDAEKEHLAVLHDRPWSELAELNTASIRMLAGRFGITTPIHLASSIPDLPDEQADERLIALCRHFDADTYLAGAGGHDYMDLERWKRAGIRVCFQTFEHPVYPQLHGEFIPALAAVDLLFNQGADGFSLVRRMRVEAA